MSKIWGGVLLSHSLLCCWCFTVIWAYSFDLTQYTHTWPLLTCVWDEALEVCAGALVLQQLLRRQVCEEHLEDSLGVQTVPGVRVPHRTVSQERLWVRSKPQKGGEGRKGRERKKRDGLYYFICWQTFFPWLLEGSCGRMSVLCLKVNHFLQIPTIPKLESSLYKVRAIYIYLYTLLKLFWNIPVFHFFHLSSLLED